MIKRCKLCGGEPKWVHYAIPRKNYPDGWKEMEDGCLEPMVLFKRLECKECKATTVQLAMNLDDAIEMWNDGKVLMHWIDERARNVEPKEE